MLFKGTPHKDGCYTVSVQGPRSIRKFMLWLFTLRQPRPIKNRTDRYIIFDRKD